MPDTVSRLMAIDPSSWIRRRSVKSRVSISATAMLTLALVVAALLLTGLEKRSLIREIDAGLNDRISGLIDEAVGGQLPVDVPLTGREPGIVQVFDHTGAIIAATPKLHTATILKIFPPRVTEPLHRTVELAIGATPSETWRIAGQRVDPGSGTIDIFVATSLESVNNAAARLQVILFAGVLILAAVFAVVSWLTTRWSLAPVEALTETVDAMSASDLQQHLPEPTSGDEFAHLVNTMNGLLSRVAETRQRERRFAADASHELRTPLTTARLNLEIALANPTPAHLTTAVKETLVEIERLEILARDLLELTRLDRARVAANSSLVNISRIIEKELSLRARQHPNLQIESAVCQPVTAFGVDSLITRVVRNVLDNAVYHARTKVRIEAMIEGAMATIQVHNDGIPIEEKDRERIFAPFTRLDNARSRDDGGTGLGLAIAADIVEAHGGTISVLNTHLTGATFRLTIPARAKPVGNPN